ncbi:metallopeptidase family protein [Limimaricola pyoseonensis]|uniref:Predicted Zn-dependent protease, minimal metalloprotease (MMP)-like domain n=1 Tax=Limimaricola pyoseonensis TaxID=521013 RepID=A0A1G7G4P7_9RHOB|nr:metallopeptidase family protein [Limimaricola pyoseonensis]SDE83067.1 Predicted Zn-dependent protease, minimal metalloprotease (MMP)-like domain [Limimaricola pyoseonensis]
MDSSTDPFESSPLAPSTDEMEQIARHVVETMPPRFREAARAVAIRVLDFATDEMLAQMEMEAFELTGLYDGIPLTEKSTWDMPQGPDVVWLFRRPILDEWAERGDVSIAEMVAHVTVHEFAHHFGWSDDDIAAIDQWWL